jgi:predicted RNA-binding protein associated with RNAse of E/G family
MKTITVIKQDFQGRETHRYSALLLELLPHEIKIEAFFDREDTLVDEIVLTRGDRFIEHYYDNRWYNIFEIRDRIGDHLKCWYCNICCPTVFDENTITYRDLALDLLVYPDGKQVILDEHEFSSLPLSPTMQTAAWQAMVELQERFQSGNNLLSKSID